MAKQTYVKPCIDSFLKLFRQLDYSLREDQKFTNFVDIAFAFYRMPFIQNGKQLFLDAFNKYEQRDKEIYSQMFELMIDVMELEHQDFLGQAFMQLELGNAYKGQFFTPYCVCKMMARMNINARDIKRQHGYITVSEPCSGAGAMIIALAEAMLEADVNPSTKMWVETTDVDQLAAKMCFVQLSAYGIAAQVIWGNSLTMETWDKWLTPMYFIEDWPHRHAVRTMTTWMRDMQMPGDQEPSPVEVIDSKAPKPSPVSSGAIQLNLFT